MCKEHYWKEHLCALQVLLRSKFYCVHSSHDLCARTHVLSLDGTLVATVAEAEEVVVLAVLPIAVLAVAINLQY